MMKAARQTTTLQLLAVLSAGLLVWGLATLHRPSDFLSLALLALGGAALEITAVRFPGGRVATAAFGCYLAAALLPALGFGWACMLTAIGVLLRMVAAGRKRLDALELLAEALPALLAAATVHILTTPMMAGLAAPWWTVAGAAVLQGFWSRRVADEALEARLRLDEEDRRQLQRARERLNLVDPVVGFLGVLLAQAALANPWNLLWGLPVLAGLQRSIGLSVEKGELEDRQDLSDQLFDQRFEQQQVAHRMEQVREELRRRHKAYLTLQELSLTLTRIPEVDRVLQTVVDMVGRLVDCSSVVVFLVEEGALAPVRYNSPHAKRLKDASLLQVNEPVAEAALRTGTVRRLGPKMAGMPRLLEGEPTAVAFPMGKLGVLYVGRARPGGFAHDEMDTLALVAIQATLALQSSRRYEAQKQAAELHAAVRQDLQEWVTGAEQLLRGFREMAAQMDPEGLIQGIDETMALLLPDSSRAIVTLGPDGAPTPRLLRTLGEECHAPLEAIVRAVVEGRRPLLFEDLSGSRLEPLFPEQHSLLAVPMQTENAVVGALVAGSSAASAYSRKEQDLLSILAYQAATALENARLHAQTREAFESLQESQARLLESSKLTALGQMAAGVTHELNTPLGAVMLAVDFALMSGPASPEVTQQLQAAVREIERAQTIVQGLLDFTRGVRQDHQVEVDLNQVLAETLDIIGYELTKSGVRILRDFSSLPPTYCHPSEIQQVAINLLLNARDAVEGREDPTVRVSTRSEDNRVIFDVEDQGVGIAPESLAQVFEPFYTTKPVGKGTGLGLSVSRSIVENHGGEMRVESEPGRGTLFSVRLPTEGNEATRARKRKVDRD
ncbi:MAG: GAF domain-containing protein [Armatimonadetes bacterium]|nr:GAF domain-containing protein [Armatimonadota bacterium]